MKTKYLKKLIWCLSLVVLSSCNEKADKPKTIALVDTDSEIINESTSFKPSEDFKNYWYAGEAEISSYKLEQARYGEMRNGEAVLIFVTEDFVPKTQVKADRYDSSNTSVLKLNATKSFNTGIYPYSIMQSTFFPVKNSGHALKVTCSVQEWCGQVYTQLNNRDTFEVKSHSYFESEGDQEFSLSKTILENELWTQLRLDPKSLPTGIIEVVPALEYIRLKHIALKAYSARAEFDDSGKYVLNYPELNRTLQINFNSEFPYDIQSWEETYVDGYGSSAKELKTKATKLSTIKSAYWSKNSNKDEALRKVLKLK